MLAAEKFEGEILNWGFVPLAHEPHAVAQWLQIVGHALYMIVDAAVIRMGPIADWVDASVEAHAGWGDMGAELKQYSKRKPSFAIWSIVGVRTSSFP